MAGRNQHYLPQFLLRGFATHKSSKQSHATVYSKTRGIFGANIRGVGAERLFYSNLPQSDSERTLDDAITEHETELSTYIEHLRTVPASEPLDSERVSQAIVHLCIRLAHVRESFADAALDIFEQVSARSRDERWMLRYLRLNDPSPSRLVRDAIRSAYRENRTAVQRSGLTQIEFERRALELVRSKAPEVLTTQMPLLDMLLDRLRAQSQEMARQAHIKALEKHLVPPLRVEALKRLQWSVQATGADTFVLPDCVAVAELESGDNLPLVFANGSDLAEVVMPITPNRIVVGRISEQTNPDPARLLDRFATCSWDFFVARHETDHFRSKAESIGATTRAFLAAMISDAGNAL